MSIDPLSLGLPMEHTRPQSATIATHIWVNSTRQRLASTRSTTERWEVTRQICLRTKSCHRPEDGREPKTGLGASYQPSKCRSQQEVTHQGRDAVGDDRGARSVCKTPEEVKKAGFDPSVALASVTRGVNMRPATPHAFERRVLHYTWPAVAAHSSNTRRLI